MDDALPSTNGRAWTPPSIEDRVTWGKHRGISYRELAVRDPAYTRWAASTIGGLKGQLCAEALAVHLGVEQ